MLYSTLKTEKLSIYEHCHKDALRCIVRGRGAPRTFQHTDAEDVPVRVPHFTNCIIMLRHF